MLALLDTYDTLEEVSEHHTNLTNESVSDLEEECRK